MPTKPHPQRPEQKGMEFNMIMLDIARQYDIPVINMWAAVRNLPENGMENDLLHFTYSHSGFLNFNGGEEQWGYTRWNLEVLENTSCPPCCRRGLICSHARMFLRCACV